jgi:hypothetical protein
VAVVLVNTLVTPELLELLHLLVLVQQELLQRVADVVPDITTVIQNQEVLVVVAAALK